MSEDAITVSYDPKKGKTGFVRFVVVDNPSTKTHIAVAANAQGRGINEIGLLKFDFVEVKWIDKETWTSGEVFFINRPDEHSYDSKFDADTEPSDFDVWTKTAGIDYRLPGRVFPAVSDEKLMEIAQQLEEGRISQKYTTASLQRLQNKWGAQRVIETGTSNTYKSLLENK